MRFLKPVLPFTFGVLALTTVLILRHNTVSAIEPVSHGGRELLAKYQSIRKDLEKNQFGLPVYIESREEDSSLRVDVYDIVDHPFENIGAALRSPGGWCDFTLLHLNTKACTWRKETAQWMVKLYNGHKHYQPPDDAEPLDMKFRIVTQQPEYLSISLTAAEGPLFTTDHKIVLEAVPLDKVRTFLHFSHAYSYGAVARMAIKSYFATIGRGKIGFTVTGTDENGKPAYIRGVRGALERNAVRYYLALEVYMDSLKLPEDQRFEKGIARWYDLTEMYARQLHEVSRDDYLTDKRKEHANQIQLQKKEGKQ